MSYSGEAEEEDRGNSKGGTGDWRRGGAEQGEKEEECR